jgi:hypothetical protein
MTLPRSGEASDFLEVDFLVFIKRLKERESYPCATGLGELKNSARAGFGALLAVGLLKTGSPDNTGRNRNTASYDAGFSVRF